METTPRPIIDHTVWSSCSLEVTDLERLTTGGLNEAYLATVSTGPPVIVRIARRSEPWFTNERSAMARARAGGVPTPDVLGVHHIDHDSALLSFSILERVQGRALDDLAPELSPSEVDRLVMDSGELLALLHSVSPEPETSGEASVGHELVPPDEVVADRVMQVATEALGVEAAAIVGRGLQLIRDQVMSGPAPACRLAHGDWLPKHMLIGDERSIVGVIDWEFAGTAPPSFDLAHWEASAGAGLHDKVNILRRGYGRVANPREADAGWVPAFAISFAIDVLSWQNPASPERLRRCVDVIARHVGA